MNGDLSSKDVQDLVVLDFVKFFHSYFHSRRYMGSQLHYAITTLAQDFVEFEFIQLCFGEYIYLFPFTICGFCRFPEEKTRLLDPSDLFLRYLHHVFLPWTVELMSLLPILLSTYITAVNHKRSFLYPTVVRCFSINHVVHALRTEWA